MVHCTGFIRTHVYPGGVLSANSKSARSIAPNATMNDQNKTNETNQDSGDQVRNNDTTTDKENSTTNPSLPLVPPLSPPPNRPPPELPVASPTAFSPRRPRSVMLSGDSLIKSPRENLKIGTRRNSFSGPPSIDIPSSSSPSSSSPSSSSPSSSSPSSSALSPSSSLKTSKSSNSLIENIKIVLPSSSTANLSIVKENEPPNSTPSGSSDSIPSRIPFSLNTPVMSKIPTLELKIAHVNRKIQEWQKIKQQQQSVTSTSVPTSAPVSAPTSASNLPRSPSSSSLQNVEQTSLQNSQNHDLQQNQEHHLHHQEQPVRVKKSQNPSSPRTSKKKSQTHFVIKTDSQNSEQKTVQNSQNGEVQSPKSKRFALDELFDEMEMVAEQVENAVPSSEKKSTSSSSMSHSPSALFKSSSETTFVIENILSEIISEKNKPEHSAENSSENGSLASKTSSKNEDDDHKKLPYLESLIQTLEGKEHEEDDEEEDGDELVEEIMKAVISEPTPHVTTSPSPLPLNSASPPLKQKQKYKPVHKSQNRVQNQNSEKEQVNQDTELNLLMDRLEETYSHAPSTSSSTPSHPSVSPSTTESQNEPISPRNHKKTKKKDAANSAQQSVSSTPENSETNPNIPSNYKPTPPPSTPPPPLPTDFSPAPDPSSPPSSPHPAPSSPPISPRFEEFEKSKKNRISTKFTRKILKLKEKEEEKEKDGVEKEKKEEKRARKVSVFVTKPIPIAEPNLDMYPKKDTSDIIWEPPSANSAANSIAAISSVKLISSFFEQHSIEWKRVLIVMHQYFINTSDLLEFLRENKSQNEEKQEKCATLLCDWFDINPSSLFLEDSIFEFLTDTLLEFPMEIRDKIFHQLKSSLENYVKSICVNPVFENVILPPPILPRNSLQKLLYPSDPSLTSSDFGISPIIFDPTEIARQITLIDHRLFCAVPTSEFLNKNFAKEEKSPHLVAWVFRFNQLATWVATCVTTESSLKKRKKLVSFFILVAIELLLLRNFCSLMSVYVGLTQSAVIRMEQTWKNLRPSIEEKWTSLSEVCTPLGNFKNLRLIHENCELPAVKAPMLVLKDLTVLEECYEKYHTSPPSTSPTSPRSPLPPKPTNSDEKLLNFTKFFKLGKIIGNFSRAKTAQYFFQSIPEIQNYLLNVKVVDRQTQDYFSKLHEPNHANNNVA